MFRVAGYELKMQGDGETRRTGRNGERSVKVSGNGNKVFLLPPFHQIVSHMLYSSG